MLKTGGERHQMFDTNVSGALRNGMGTIGGHSGSRSRILNAKGVMIAAEFNARQPQRPDVSPIREI